MSRCKKLHELPPVVCAWQQETWRPDCVYYDRAACSSPERTEATAPCPFDGRALPLRENTGDPDHDCPQKPVDAEFCTEPESQPASLALDQAIKRRIGQRTGGRVQMLEVEMTDNGVVIRGCASCYYHKQLALQGVLDVIGISHATKVDFHVQVLEKPATLSVDA